VIENIISSNTLYYFFSTLAQVVAAATALIAVLVHFRITALRDFLVGDGESVLNMKKDYREERGYDLLTSKNTDRLKGAVARKDISGIEKVLKELAELEKNKSVSEDHHGFQWLYGHFSKTQNQIKEMSQTSKRAFIMALITAFYSIISILFVEIIFDCLFYSILIVGFDIILLTICFCYFIKGIKLGFDNFTNRFN
jgi:hypothetical protein